MNNADQTETSAGDTDDGGDRILMLQLSSSPVLQCVVGSMLQLLRVLYPARANCPLRSTRKVPYCIQGQLIKQHPRDRLLHWTQTRRGRQKHTFDSCAKSCMKIF